jgi:hypothetical protein
MQATTAQHVPKQPARRRAGDDLRQAKARTHDFIGYLNFCCTCRAAGFKRSRDPQRFEKIGIGPGKSWDASKVDPAILAAIDAGVKEDRRRSTRWQPRPSAPTACSAPALN